MVSWSGSVPEVQLYKDCFAAMLEKFVLGPKVEFEYTLIHWKDIMRENLKYFT